jgi:hypothetical protein
MSPTHEWSAAPPTSREGTSMFKWLCLLVAVVALSAFGWMLNDIRLQVRSLTVQADKHLPVILASTERVATRLDRDLPRLMQQSELALTDVNAQLPRLLKQAETAAKSIDANLPLLLKNSERAATTLDRQLPRLIVSAETTLDNVSDLSAGFGQYRSLMGAVHAGQQNKGLLAYARAYWLMAPASLT